LKYAKVNFDLEKRFKIIFKAFKVNNIFNLEKKIKKISENTGLELKFNKLKINKKNQINVILRNINTQRLANNPIDIQVHDIEKILLSKI
jgi:alcohol dehydrogenase class IV